VKLFQIDFKRAAYDLKLAADQENTDGRCYYGGCLQKGEGAGIDLKGAVHSLHSLLIEELRVPNSIKGFVCRMVKVFE
jgi:hypothetical protein